MPLYRANFISTRPAHDPCVNVLHVVANADAFMLTPDPSCAEVAAELGANLTAQYRALLPTEHTFDRIDVSTVTDPWVPSQVPSQGSHVVALPGLQSTVTVDLPQRICPLISWRTALAGRSFRGRTYLPPLLDSTDLTAGKLTSGSPLRIAIDAFAQKIVDASLSSGSTWQSLWMDTWHGKIVVYSPRRHALQLNPYYADITGFVTNGALGFLSSRDN